MTSLDLMVDLYAKCERQGPGSKVVTQRALSLLDLDLKNSLNICDIGCGTGAQTLVLAEKTKGKITAVDLFPAFLEELEKRAAASAYADRIKTLEASMEDLPFREESFDLIWSEGAVYNMGFEKGVTVWGKLLKAGGYLAVSEISWLSKDRPNELEGFWKEAYPEIGTVSEKISILENAGYVPLAHFILPTACWTKNYYEPLEARFDAFLERHDYSDEARSLVDSEREEIRLYHKYRDFYSYGFYLAKKRTNPSSYATHPH